MLIQRQPIPFFRLLRQPRYGTGLARPAAATPLALAPNVDFGTAFTEFYCNASTGNNMNGGSDEGSPSYTSTNGNWNGTATFTPGDSSTPFETVTPGQFAHVFIDGSTTPVYVARVLSVGTGVNGVITLSTTAKAGTAPTSSATARSIRVGGAFKGPSAAVAWPMATSFTAAVNAAANPVRMNFKNNAAYSFSTTINTAIAVLGQGYADTPGDGGKAELTAGGTGIQMFNGSFAAVDLIFHNTGVVSGANELMFSTGFCFFLRCVFHDSRGRSVTISSAGNYPSMFIECEFYRWNLANGTSGNGVQCSDDFVMFLNCYFHDSVGVGLEMAAVQVSALNSRVEFIGCIFDTITGDAISINPSATGYVTLINNTFYNISGSVLRHLTTTAFQGVFMFNNLIAKVERYIFETSSTGRFNLDYLYNNAIGSGTYGVKLGRINTTGNAPFQEYNTITLPPDVNPFNDPATGDFRLATSLLGSAGRENFTQTGSGKTGSVGFPDIGAVQNVSLISPPAWGDQVITLPDAYVGLEYTINWVFDSAVALSAVSGLLPPGLSLETVSATEAQITGTPTTLGTYTFTLRATFGGNYADSIFTITVLDAPATGFSGVGGG